MELYCCNCREYSLVESFGVLVLVEDCLGVNFIIGRICVNTSFKFLFNELIL